MKPLGIQLNREWGRKAPRRLDIDGPVFKIVIQRLRAEFSPNSAVLHATEGEPMSIEK